MPYQEQDSHDLSQAILAKAKELGADLAGIADVSDLVDAPSFVVAPKIPPATVGHSDGELAPGVVEWPEEAQSVIVVALAHPADKPELDWWHGKHQPPGNRELIRITKNLREWLSNVDDNIETYKVPYHTEKGGIFLKDAAVKANLGIVGRNNLFITPEFGPRVRMRTIIVNKKLYNPLQPISFDPCSGCDGHCLRSCPQGAFNKVIYDQAEMGHNLLPGIIGNYNRFKCNDQMEKDIERSLANPETVYYEPAGETVTLIKYCRRCELSCPVGD